MLRRALVPGRRPGARTAGLGAVRSAAGDDHRAGGTQQRVGGAVAEVVLHVRVPSPVEPFDLYAVKAGRGQGMPAVRAPAPQCGSAVRVAWSPTVITPDAHRGAGACAGPAHRAARAGVRATGAGGRARGRPYGQAALCHREARRTCSGAHSTVSSRPDQGLIESGRVPSPVSSAVTSRSRAGSASCSAARSASDSSSTTRVRAAVLARS